MCVVCVCVMCASICMYILCIDLVWSSDCVVVVEFLKPATFVSEVPQFSISVIYNFRLLLSIVYYEADYSAFLMLNRIRIVSPCQATPNATWL